jgi:hypothetical protein
VLELQFSEKNFKALKLHKEAEALYGTPRKSEENGEFLEHIHILEWKTGKHFSGKNVTQPETVADNFPPSHSLSLTINHQHQNVELFVPLHYKCSRQVLFFALILHRNPRHLSKPLCDQ